MATAACGCTSTVTYYARPQVVTQAGSACVCLLQLLERAEVFNLPSKPVCMLTQSPCGAYAGPWTKLSHHCHESRRKKCAREARTVLIVQKAVIVASSQRGAFAKEHRTDMNTQDGLRELHVPCLKSYLMNGSEGPTQWRKQPRCTYSMEPLHWQGLDTAGQLMALVSRPGLINGSSSEEPSNRQIRHDLESRCASVAYGCGSRLNLGLRRF